jgi:hypothetical protein
MTIKKEEVEERKKHAEKQHDKMKTKDRGGQRKEFQFQKFYFTVFL